MSRVDYGLAFLVVAAWGANFTVIKLGLEGMPPLLLAALRYALAAFPAVFFVPRPAVSASYLVFYGLAVGVGQFGCLFFAMHIGMPAGLASVVLQSQAFFTLLFGAVLLRESVSPRQIAGLCVAAAGLYLIGTFASGPGIKALPLSALGLTLLGAAFWGLSNIVVRRAEFAMPRGKSLDTFGLVIWSSLVPPIPLFLLAYLLSARELGQADYEINAVAVAAALYLAYVATLFGYGTWCRLLSRYPAGRVAPLSLLVPVTGLLTARLVLDEQLSTEQWIGCLLVLCGLAVGIIGGRPVRRLMRGERPERP